MQKKTGAHKAKPCRGSPMQWTLAFQDFTHVITSLQNLFQVSTEILAVSFGILEETFHTTSAKAEKELDGNTPYFKRTSVSTHLIQQLLK